jgi:hypothetical protein
LLLAALKRLGELPDEARDEFKAKVGRREGSIGDRLKETYGLELGPLKMELASEIADILNHETAWWQDKRFMETELGKFLEFIWSVL